MAGHLLFVDGIQHALHGSLHILDGLVDHAVQTHIHLLPVRNGLGGGVRTHVEADDDGVGSGSQGHVGFVDGADAAVDHLYHYLFVGELHKTLLYCLYRSLYVCLYDDGQLFHISCLDLGEQIVQG